MKKFLILFPTLLCALKSFAIDPSGAKVDYGEGGIDIPTPLAIIGLIIAIVGCFVMGITKNAEGKRDSTGMLWLGALGVMGLIFILGNL